MSIIEEVRLCRNEIGRNKFMLSQDEFRQDKEVVEIIEMAIAYYTERLEKIGKVIKEREAR